MKKSISKFILNFKYAFRPGKPKLFFRLAKAVINSSVFKRPPLRYVDFAINFDCNLNCEHCFTSAIKQPDRRKMNPDDYSRVAEECMKLGTVNFSFQGGEPLLSKNLGDIIKACRPDCNLISVTTNGTLLTKEKVKELKKIGVDIFTISLDSAIAEEHDRFRGSRGSFEKTLSGIKLSLNEGLRVTLGAVVTHQTVKSRGITGLIKLAQEFKVLLYFIMPVPAGRWVNNKEMFLSEDDLKYIVRLTNTSPYIRTDFQANLGGYGCGAAKEILYLTPYGDVLVCPFMHISAGNIFEESIEVIRNRALQEPYFARYHPKCLVSTDAEFIERYLSKTFGESSLPISWRDVFSGRSK